MAITKTKKKNKDGLYQYRVRVSYQTSDGTYKQKEKSVWGLAEAKEMEHSLMQDQAQPTRKITVNELIKEYYKVKEHEVRENTIRTSKTRVNNYIIPFLGTTALKNLTPKSLTNWKLEVEKLGLSHTTKKSAYGELRGILNFAVKLDYIPVSPLGQAGNFKTGEIQEKKIQVYTPEEFKKYIECAKQGALEKDYYDFYVFFNIAFYTGMRKGEIHALRWASLDENVIHIRKSIQQKIKGKYTETPPKNKSSIRDVQMPNALKIILDEHKKRQQLQKDFSEDKFICGYNKPLSDTSIDLKNRAFAAQADLHRIRIHDFRHTHASILTDKGIAITEISRRLGHSNTNETLNTYAHFFPKQEEAAVGVLDTL